MGIVKRSRTTRTGRYKFSEVDIQLPGNYNADVNLILPNGKIVSLQWRLDAAVSLDVCLPADLPVTNWKGDDLQPADPDPEFPEGHRRFTKQLVIDFGDEYLEAEPETDDGEVD